MYRQFGKYLKEDFNFILMNDAYDKTMEDHINTITSYNKIKCVRVPQEIHKNQNPSEGYAETLNWAVRDYAVKNDCEVIVLLHMDIFPIRDVSISNILDTNIIASTAEYRDFDGGIIYLYPAFTIINTKLINVHEIDFGLEPGLDVGAKTRNLLKKYKNTIKLVHNHQMTDYIQMIKDNPAVEYYKTDLAICRKHGLNAGWVADGFYHYMAGSQWNGGNPTFAEGHKQRMELFLANFY